MIHGAALLPAGLGFCIGDFSVSYFFLTFWSLKRTEASVGGAGRRLPRGALSAPALASVHPVLEQRERGARDALVSFGRRAW